MSNEKKPSALAMRMSRDVAVNISWTEESRAYYMDAQLVPLRTQADKLAEALRGIVGLGEEAGAFGAPYSAVMAMGRRAREALAEYEGEE